MNATYSVPYRYPAGILAFVVHCVFFALLYFGFAWQSQKPVTMSVELWSSLPDDIPARPAPPIVPPKPVDVAPQRDEAEPPPVISKPDIVLPSKMPEPKKLETRPVPPVETKKLVTKQPVKTDAPSAADLEAERQLAEQAAQAAAANAVVDEYMARISTKIKRNIVMPQDVANDARAEFSVTLLPGGRVLTARLSKSSGNAAYDTAVERAILKSDPLPLPADETMFNRFRELKLKFKPVE